MKGMKLGGLESLHWGQSESLFCDNSLFLILNTITFLFGFVPLKKKKKIKNEVCFQLL